MNNNWNRQRKKCKQKEWENKIHLIGKDNNKLEVIGIG